jgi:hypothetical protein
MIDLIGWLLTMLFFGLATTSALLLVGAVKRAERLRDEDRQTIDSTCTVVEGKKGWRA